MTHITVDQKQRIAALRAKNVSFVKISQQTGIPLGTCKTIFYKDRPAGASSFKSKDGKFKSAAPRTRPGRRPRDGLEAQSDKQRAAACRARKRERLAELVDNLGAATDGELVAMLAQAIRTGDGTVKAIVNELYTRHCAIS